MLLVRCPLTTPGEPLAPTLGSQFWPLLPGMAGLQSSSDRPVPSASASQDHPVSGVLLRMRRAQSPSSAYTTLSTLLPLASSSSISSPPLLSWLFQAPMTFATPGYLALKAATLAATTR